MSIPRFWKNIVLPGWHAIWKLGLLFIFLLLAIGAGLWAYLLQQVAFPQAGSSADQISATVYVQTLPAHVNLQSMFTPSAAANNVSFTVTVTGPTKRPDPWILVVQCTTPPDQPQGAVPLWSETAAGKQPSGTVLVRHGPTRTPLSFTCVTGLAEQDQTAATVVQNRDLNLSLPVLEQNPVAGSALAGAPMWAERVAGKYRNIVEVQALPAAPCPTPSPSPASPAAGSASPSAGTPSPSPTALSSTPPATTASPSATATASATASPSPPATVSATASPIAPACYTPASMSPGTTSVKYSFPAPANGTMVATSEVLNDVKLSNERIDSMYPQGVITTDEVTWTGSAGLSPSLSATNLASAERQNKDAFWAGLLYGIAAALAIPYLVEFYKTWQDEMKRPKGTPRARPGP